ncbi:hypothetical protein SAMN06265367_102535 [Algoriphagus winogradskyi]|uniref:Uncharacterized protein n=1 Tax=Algoriphagus winogradskyi TaxID=237017 RepID=A0ABY1NR00_9BACT|nr:hypothetical protein SAMN06265367_102535 [Algoriphagus winogradskyi]
MANSSEFKTSGHPSSVFQPDGKENRGKRIIELQDKALSQLLVVA